MIFAGLAYVARTAMIKCPNLEQVFSVTTLALCATSAFLLIVAWRTVDKAIAQEGNRSTGKAAYVFFIAVVIIVLGIFLYWG